MAKYSFSIDQDYLTRTTQQLVHINSINPSLTSEGKGEAEIGAYIAEKLELLGLDMTTTEIEPGRVNVVGVFKGSGGGRSLLLNAHLDTVGVEGMDIDPFSGEIRDGRLYGRGSQDMKASLAAMMAAAKALVDAHITLRGDLLITAVADEEYASIGTETLIKAFTADAAIVTEPTDMHVCRTHRGFIWFDIETFGRAAHGSRYAEGIDVFGDLAFIADGGGGLRIISVKEPARPREFSHLDTPGYAFDVHVARIPFTPLDHGIGAPVQVDAQLGVTEPIRHLVLLQ